MKWAHASACAWLLSDCCGPAQVHQQGKHIHTTGQCNHFMPYAAVMLMGQYELVVWVPHHMKWAHASSSAQLLSGCCRPTRACWQGWCIHRTLNAPMQGLTLESWEAAVGQLELIGKGQPFATLANVSIFSAAIPLAADYMGLCGSLVWQLIVRLMGQCVNCLNIRVHEMGPCKCLCAIYFRLLWANPSSSNVSIFLAAIPPAADYIGLHGSLVQRLIVRFMGQCANFLNIRVHEMGPCKCLHAIYFRLLWANPSSSARGSSLTM